MIFEIKSSKNENYKYFKSLKQKKSRNEHKKYTVEGIKSVRDAISASAGIDSIIVSESFYKNDDFSYPANKDIYIISDNIFPAITTTENSQGILAVLDISDNDIKPDKNYPYIYCDRIQDPGNLGTIIRTADAAGFGGVILSEDSVDLYNPKTVRSSMGSFFHIPIKSGSDIDFLKKYQSLGFNIVCGVLSDKTIEYTKADLTKPVIIVIGNEANGICDEILSISDVNIKIPIEGDAESLNAAIAAAVIMYETNRQRRNK